MELPKAWSGSKRIGVADADTRTVEMVLPAAVPLLAVTSGAGIMVKVAAALAEARNWRREMGGVFMTGQYNGNVRALNAQFRLVKRFNMPFRSVVCIACRSGFALAGQPKAIPT